MLVFASGRSAVSVVRRWRTAVVCALPIAVSGVLIDGRCTVLHLPRSFSSGRIGQIGGFSPAQRHVAGRRYPRGEIQAVGVGQTTFDRSGPFCAPHSRSSVRPLSQVPAFAHVATRTLPRRLCRVPLLLAVRSGAGMAGHSSGAVARSEPHRIAGTEYQSDFRDHAAADLRVGRPRIQRLPVWQRPVEKAGGDLECPAAD